MEFRILGIPAVAADSGSVRLGGSTELAILAALLVNAERVVTTDRLVDILWGEEPPETAVKTLRSHVSRLRSRLAEWGEPIETVSGGYVLHLDTGQLDAAMFEELLDAARRQRDRGAHAGAVAALREGLQLWQGRALTGLDDYDFARLEAARLEELRLEALEALFDSELELGHHERIVAEIDQAVQEQPLREGLWSALMTALYRSNRQADALRAYQRARRIMGDELGIEPSPELRDLEQAILLQSAAVAPSPNAARYEVLPDSRTSFIGRQTQIAELRALLADHRGVTVTGSGGAGKTRLALEAVRGVVDRYEHGVLFVELAPVVEPSQVPVHVAAALGDVGSHAADITTALLEFLNDKNLLVVIDNCEHVVRAVAPLVDRLLAACPQLSVLATSRESLGTRGEVLFHTPPLDVPHPDVPHSEQDSAESVLLFVDRVRAFDRAFTIHEETRAAVGSICRTLDGIPLALELAAAKVRGMTPAEIAARMDDRFTLLDAGPRTAPPRQQTLRAMIEWSYELCPDEARRTLQRLAVFAGGCSLEAAEAVVADAKLEQSQVAGLLDGLVNRNLVEHSVTTSGSRYQLLETIRQFAFDELVTSGEASTTARRHSSWFVDFAERADPALRSGDQVEWLRRLDADHDNCRAAIGWAMGSDDPRDAFRLVAALGWYWFMRGHWHEAWSWTARCVELEDEVDPVLWSRAVSAAGSIEIIRGKLDPMQELLGRALAYSRQAGDRLGEAWALHYIGHAGTWTESETASTEMQGALDIFEELNEPWAEAWSWRYIGQVSPGDQSLDLQQRALERFFALGDRWCAAFSLYLIGTTLMQSGRFEEATAAEEEALAIASELGDVIWKAHATGRLGMLAYFRGAYGQADSMLDEAVELHRRIGDENCAAILLAYRGLLRGAEERWVESLRYLAQSLGLWSKLGISSGLALTLARFARALAGHGHTREAALIYGAASPDTHGIHYSSQNPLLGPERRSLESLLQSEVGDEYDALLAEGAELELDEAYGKAMALAERLTR